jgi:hypothetical protein
MVSFKPYLSIFLLARRKLQRLLTAPLMFWLLGGLWSLLLVAGQLPVLLPQGLTIGALRLHNAAKFRLPKDGVIITD